MKIKRMLLSMLLIPFLYGCNNNNNPEPNNDYILPGSWYEIEYKDDVKNHLYNDCPTGAVPGSTVMIKAYIISDADLVLYAYLEDGLDYFNETLNYTNEDDYWVFTFTMPGCPVTIDYDIVGGM